MKPESCWLNPRQGGTTNSHGPARASQSPRLRRDRHEALAAKAWKTAWAAALCGTVAWLALVSISPHDPDAAHPARYASRHDVRYVSEDMGLVLRILFGVNVTLALVAAGCHFAGKDARGGDWPGRIGEP